MKLSEIENEGDLRTWLREHITPDVALQWIEPFIYGSSVGATDCIMKCGSEKVDVELKYLERTRKGTKFTLRPSQRRFHHISMKNKIKTSLLAVERVNDRNILFLVRGDHIPLRDYASDPDSGCANGEVIRTIISRNGNDRDAINKLKMLLFFDMMRYWE